MRFQASSFFSAVLVFSVLLGAGVSDRSASGQEVMPAHIADQLGMVEVWNRTVASQMGVQSIADMQLFVHSSDPKQYVEIFTADSPAKTAKAASGKKATSGKKAAAPAKEKVLSRITIGTVDRFGKVMDQKEAERLASNELRKLKRRGIKASMRSITSPRVCLYSISDDGTLQARDAETGETLWMRRLGDTRLTYGELGINDERVVVINGSNLISVDIKNGEIITEFRLLRTPIFGALNSGHYATVMSINGGITCYHLDELERDPFYEMVSGKPLAAPTRAPLSTKVAWATDQGFVFAMELDGEPSTMFRLKTDGLVAGRIAAAKGNRFFFGSESGQVYGLKATRTGEVLWSAPFGEPFYGEPIVIEDQLFIRSTYGNLFCLATDTGVPVWDIPVRGVKKLVGAFGGKLFVELTGGQLAVINRETGVQIGNFPSVKPTATIKNDLTNRLYLVNSRGVVQCLRPVDSELPRFNAQPDMSGAKASSLSTGQAAEEDANGVFDSGEKASPFGDDRGDADPFGGDDADPFSGDDDPFGGDDPFGN